MVSDVVPIRVLVLLVLWRTHLRALAFPCLRLEGSLDRPVFSHTLGPAVSSWVGVNRFLPKLEKVPHSHNSRDSELSILGSLASSKPVF